MSAQHNHAAHGDHHDDHGHGHDDGPHSTFSGYMIGFFLSIILTAIPFAVVMGDVFESRTTTMVVISAFAVVQILVHMVFFLHMNGKVEGGWTMLSTIFTIIFVCIVIAGTLWVMHNMNAHMMPQHQHLLPGGAEATQAAPHGAHH
ncbi:MAG: cytochrome o ubiquinol oxidase subunit IV [Comamonas sp.]